MTWIHAQVLVITVITGSAALAFDDGLDLSSVDRTILKEPRWSSGEPKYCLFVVSVEKRVWFVMNGDDLYMDINGNGDLTDPGEKLPRLNMSPEERRKSRNSSRWRIPDIYGNDGKPIIKNIQIDVNKKPGTSFDSTFVYFDSPYRAHVFTRPTFANNPADAPILHPCGPVRLQVKVRPFVVLRAATGVGQERVSAYAFHVVGQLYVDGVGPGTRFLIETPTLDCRIEFPLADGTTKVKEMRLMQSADGGLNQSNSATHPDGTGEGIVKINVSMPPSARGLTVKPVLVEKPLAELRVLRRETRPR